MENRTKLSVFSHALARQAHILTRRPDLTWPQLFNDLRWQDEILGDQLWAELESRRAQSASPWLGLRTPLNESGTLLRTLLGHTSIVWACAYSPNGRYIISASADLTLKIWDAETGQESGTLRGHKETEEDLLLGKPGGVHACAFSPDGRRIASAGKDGTLKLWDAEAMQELADWYPGHPLYACAFSPDGQRILSGGRALDLWDAETGQKLARLLDDDLIHTCAFSPDGRRIVSGSFRRLPSRRRGLEFIRIDPALRLFDAGTGQELATLRGHADEGRRYGELRGLPFTSTPRVRACAFSPDSRRIVSASEDRTLRLWDAETGQVLANLLGHAERVCACAFSPCGRYIVSGSEDSTLKIWSVETGKALDTLHGHAGGVYACAFSPDGRQVVSASFDHTLKLWEIPAGRVSSTRSGHLGPVHACAFSPDGRRIVSAGWDETLKIWDAETGEETATLQGQAEICACAFSPDGRRIVTADTDGKLTLWDPVTAKERALVRAHVRANVLTSACGFSPDGRRVVSAGGTEWELKLWNAKALQGTVPSLRAAIAVTLQGRRSRNDRFRRTIDWLFDRILKTTETANFIGHTAVVLACAFSPDGRRIVSAGADATLRIWDAETARELATLAGHRGSVGACAYSPDGRRIVSASADRMLKVWDAEGGREVAALALPGALHCVSHHPFAPRIATGDDGGNMYLLDLVSPGGGHLRTPCNSSVDGFHS